MQEKDAKGRRGQGPSNTYRGTKITPSIVYVRLKGETYTTWKTNINAGKKPGKKMSVRRVEGSCI